MEAGSSQSFGECLPSPGTLCLQGWGAASPRGDTPGGQMEAKKVSLPFGSGYRMWAQTTG